MTRKERKTRANKKRLAIKSTILHIITQELNNFKDLNDQIAFKKAIKRANIWCNKRMKECPQEAHMIKQVAIQLATELKEDLKS